MNYGGVLVSVFQNTLVELKRGGACAVGQWVGDFEIRMVVEIRVRVGIQANSTKKHPAIVEEYERLVLIGAYVLKTHTGGWRTLICGQERTHCDLGLGDHVPHDKSRGPFSLGESETITTEEYPDIGTSLLDLILKRSAQYVLVRVDVNRKWLTNSVKVDG